MLMDKKIESLVEQSTELSSQQNYEKNYFKTQDEANEDKVTTTEGDGGF